MKGLEMSSGFNSDSIKSFGFIIGNVLTACFKLIGGMWNTVESLMRLSTKSVSR